MPMGNEGAVDAAPRINIEIPCSAVDPIFGKAKDVRLGHVSKIAGRSVLHRAMAFSCERQFYNMFLSEA
jgi:hypothetical protein